MTLRCDQGGVYNNSLDLTEETCHQRQKSTRPIDCPFAKRMAQLNLLTDRVTIHHPIACQFYYGIGYKWGTSIIII